MVEIEYSYAEMAYLFAFKIEGRWETIKVPLIETIGKTKEEVLNDVASLLAGRLDDADIVDVEYHIERPALPRPTLL